MAKPSQRGLGLRGRLITLVLISILPMLAFAGILLLEVATAERNTLEARVQDTARAISLIVDQEIGQAQASISALAASDDLDVGNFERFDAQARRITSAPDHWIILFNTRRDQLVNTLRPFGTALPKNISAPAVDEVLRTSRPAVTNLLPSEGPPVVRTAVPVIRDGEILYVIALAFTVEALSRLLASQDMPAAWRVDIQDRAGRLIARNRAAEQFVGQVGSKPLHARSAMADQGVLRTNTMEGEAAYAAFKRSDLTGWTTSVAAPLSSFEVLLQRSSVLLLGGGVALLTVGLIFAIQSARQIAKPVEALTEAATLLGHGGIPNAPVTDIREINAVGTALESAAHELRERQARLREAQDIARLGRWEFDTAARTIIWSDEEFAIFGRNKHLGEPTYEELRGMIHPDDRDNFDAISAAALMGDSFETEWRIVWPNGSVHWRRTRARPFWNDRGEVVRLVGTDIDITEQKRADEALAAAHSRTLEILESITDAFYALDGDGRFIYANRRALELWHKRHDEVIGRRAVDVFPNIEATESWMAQQRVAADRHPLHIETISPILGRWISLSIYPAAANGLTVYFRDITARKNAERQQALLIDELNHRVKNTLAAVQSIVAQGLRGTHDPESFAHALQGRLMALSGAHDLLTRTSWEGANFADVVRTALAPFAGGHQRVRFEGPAVTVAPNVAVALSMAFHELATNAAKYGALSGADGRVTVTWTLAEGAAATIIHWQESGGPAVTPPTGRGFGSRLIEHGLAYELDSEVILEFLPAGVECRIRLPLPTKIGSIPNE